MSRMYHTCRRYMGKTVWVRCRDGRMHQGRIVRVSSSHVYLAPLGRTISEQGNKSAALAQHTLGTKQEAKGSEILFFSPLAIPLAAIIGIGLIGAAAAYRPWFWY